MATFQSFMSTGDSIYEDAVETPSAWTEDEGNDGDSSSAESDGTEGGTPILENGELVRRALLVVEGKLISRSQAPTLPLNPPLLPRTFPPPPRQSYTTCHSGPSPPPAPVPSSAPPSSTWSSRRSCTIAGRAYRPTIREDLGCNSGNLSSSSPPRP